MKNINKLLGYYDIDIYPEINEYLKHVLVEHTWDLTTNDLDNIVGLSFRVAMDEGVTTGRLMKDEFLKEMNLPSFTDYIAPEEMMPHVIRGLDVTVNLG